MDATLSADDPCAESVQLVTAICCLAERDADDTARFLEQFNLKEFLPSDREGRIELPREFLLGIGLVVRFHRWESSGIDAHIRAGLPSADQLLDRIIEQLGKGLQSPVDQVLPQSLRVYANAFVWADDDAISAELAVATSVSDDAFLDALADLVWKHRHSLPVNENKP